MEEFRHHVGVHHLQYRGRTLLLLVGEGAAEAEGTGESAAGGVEDADEGFEAAD